MTIDKSINAFGLGQIRMTYTELDHRATDNEIVIYDDFKISIHLSDGLYGVMDNRIVGGKRGDVLLYAPNEVHFGRFAFDGRFRFVNLFISKEFQKQMEKEYPPFHKLFDSLTNERSNCISAGVEEKAEIVRLTEALVELARDNSKEDIRSFSLILDLLLYLEGLNTSSYKSEPTSYASPIVQRTLEYVHKNFGEKITVRELSNIAKCSTVYLCKSFKSYMGRSIHQYITEYRIKQSVGFLNAGSSVAEACYKAGFSDCSNFINTFKKIMKTTPYKYKNRMQ